MHLAKEIIKQAGIPDAKWEAIENDTVGSNIVLKHPGPIVNARDITVKDKQWQDVGSGYLPGHLSRQNDWSRRLDAALR